MRLVVEFNQFTLLEFASNATFCCGCRRIQLRDCCSHLSTILHDVHLQANHARRWICVPGMHLLPITLNVWLNDVLPPLVQLTPRFVELYNQLSTSLRLFWTEVQFCSPVIHIRLDQSVHFFPILFHPPILSATLSTHFSIQASVQDFLESTFGLHHNKSRSTHSICPFTSLHRRSSWNWWMIWTKPTTWMWSTPISAALSFAPTSSTLLTPFHGSMFSHKCSKRSHFSRI